MHKTILHSIFSFILLTLLQVLILNNIQFLGFIHPYVYILFVLSLPLKTSRNLCLLLAFFLGLTIDMFSNTLGLHAFATVLVSFFRPFLLGRLVTHEDSGFSGVSAASLGFFAYLKYITILVSLHCLTLFSLEGFLTVSFQDILYRAVLSAAVTILFILAIQLFKTRNA